MGQARPVALIQGVGVFVLCQFGVVGRESGEGVGGESGGVFLHDAHVQSDVLHVAVAVLHAVAGIGLYGERTVGIVGESDGVVRGYFLHILLLGHWQSEPEGAVLEEQELAAAVGCAHHEVVERLVILHQVGLYELGAVAQFLAVVFQVPRGSLDGVSQVAQAAGVGVEEHALESERLGLVVEDVAELSRGEHLAVFVERHQLVHTVDGELDEHLRRVAVHHDLRIHHVDEIVLGDLRVAVVVGHALRLVDDGELGVSHREDVVHVFHVGHGVHTHLGLDETGLIDLSCELHALQGDGVVRVADPHRRAL